MSKPTTQNQLLDLIMSMRGFKTDYQLAKHMGIPLQTLRNYRKNRSNMNATMCVQVAQELKMDAMQVIARVKCEAANDERTRRVWEKHLGRVLLVVATVTAQVDPANAQMTSETSLTNIHYAHIVRSGP